MQTKKKRSAGPGHGAAVRAGLARRRAALGLNKTIVARKTQPALFGDEPEIAALRVVLEALIPLPAESQARVLKCILILNERS
jgi:hypothetical protein